MLQTQMSGFLRNYAALSEKLPILLRFVASYMQ